MNKQLRSFAVLSLLGVVALSMPPVVAGETPIDIGSQWELLVDRYLIDEMKGGAELRLHRPVAREIVFVHDKPWEGNTCGYSTIFRDGDIYRMYYRGSNTAPDGRKTHREVTCYAESRDGIRWERPELGLFEFEGSRANNIVWDSAGTHNFTPFRDTNPDCPPEAQYKAVARGTDEYHQSLLAFQSPDGIHWKRMQEKPVVTEGAFDSQNLAFWDAERKEYRCYLRDFRDGKRDIKTCTSKDFLSWTKPVWLDYGDAPREHLYTNAVRPYYRAPQIFIGFPTRYEPDRGSAVEPLFMTSRDGLTFRRWGEAIIRAGRNRARWGNRSNYIWWGLVETESDLPGAGRELSLYSNEAYERGGGGKLRRFTYRIDGFVSINAPLAGGEVITKPLVFEGREIAMNFSTSAAGSIRVELQDASGNPLPGFALTDCPAIYGDEIEGVMKWKQGADLSGLAGKPIRLRIALHDADLFAFGFR